MPYAKWSEVNPAIRGIKPQVTLAMANHIADVADAIERAGTADNPWAAAIAAFKREYKVSGGRWMKRRRPARESDVSMSMIDLVLAEMYEALLGGETTELAEARTKAMGGRKHQRGDFLVQGEEDKPSTWHLPVRLNGKPNRRLAGAAWAALFNPEGFRGNRYSGPDASKAKAALKALYKAQEWETPAGEVAEGDWYPSMDGRTDYSDLPPVPWNAKTFADVEMAVSAREATGQLHALTYQFGELARNVLNDSDPEATSASKLAALRDLAEEYLSRVGALLEEVDGGPAPAGERAKAPVIEYVGDPEATTLGESRTGAALALHEDGGATADGKSVPLLMDVQLIEPGFGNRRDRNYYPREMLARDARVFEGAKMFESDHRPNEKSTRTWVSTVRAIKGFTPTGAPVAEVVVHDEDFAKRVRALAEATDAEGNSMLRRMECSILGAAKARKAKVDGKEANIVEQITEAHAVDWVTSAGAGGRALNIAESEGGKKMDRILTVKVKDAPAEADAEALKVKLMGQAADLFGEGAKLEEVTLAEAGDESTAEPEPAPEPEPEPPVLDPAEVARVLAEAHVPAAVMARLVGGKYADAEAVKKAATAEIQYLKDATGSGKVMGAGDTRPVGEAGAMTPEQADAERKVIAAKYGLPTG